jgi:hypothetical protein
MRRRLVDDAAIVEGTIALVGGTGNLGRGLALRLAAAGRRVRIGSRVAARATAAAGEIRARLTDVARAGTVEGGENAAVVRGAALVFLTVPFAALDAVVGDLAPLLGDAIVVDTVVPLAMRGDEVDVDPPAEGSVSAHLRARLPRARIVAALKTVPAVVLQDLAAPLEGDVLLAADDPEAAAAVAALLAELGDLRGRLVGSLDRAGLIEAATAITLNLNRRYGGHAQVRFPGLLRG